MKTENYNRGFLSYSHKDKQIADYIDDLYQSSGYLIQRDERDAPNGVNIYSFMNVIKKSPFVVIIYSLNYVKSAGAMFEAMEWMDTNPDDFFEKAAIVMVDNSLTDDMIISEITKYWAEQISNPLNEELQSDSFKKRWTSKLAIAKGVNNFMSKIAERKIYYTLSSIKLDSGRHLVNRVSEYLIMGAGTGRRAITEFSEYILNSDDIETVLIETDKQIMRNPERLDIYVLKAKQLYKLKYYRLANHTIQTALDTFTSISNEELSELKKISTLCVKNEYSPNNENGETITAYLLEEENPVGGKYSCFKDLETAKIYFRKRKFDSSYKIYEVKGRHIDNDVVVDAMVMGDSIIGPIVEVTECRIINY